MSFFKTTILLTAFVGFLSAHAEIDPRSLLNQINLIEVRAEYYPNDTYYLGYAENADHSLNSIFYETNSHQKTYYSISDLSDEVPIIQTTSGGKVYDLVRLQGQIGDEVGAYNITMRYMKNGLFKNTKPLNFSLEYNSSRQVFEVKKAETGEIINRIYATTNFWGKRAVGIDKIICSK